MKQPVSEYKKVFIARTKQAREDACLTQKQMGQALGGIRQDIYKNYETIRELPHEYIPTFCLVCGVTANWLFDVADAVREDAVPSRGRVGRPRINQVGERRPVPPRRKQA